MFVIACIPAFNEEKVIGNLIKKMLSYVDEVVVCDDGSSDQTSKEAEKAGAVVIKHQHNEGKGAALKSLFQYARKNDADIAITIDGDGQFLPEETPKLIKPIQDKNSDIVIGYRFDDESDMPSYRKVGNKMLDKITNLASELPFRDTQSGFRAYSKKALNSINFLTDGFGADSEILIDASKKGLKISEEKVTVIYNTGGKTSTKNPVSHSSDVIGSILELVALKHPLKYLGLPGFILLVIGVIYSVVVISIFNSTRYFSIPSTMLALGSLVIGLMLLLMSVVLFSINRATRRIS
ncbi:Glycosyltransferase, group 2 family protein [Nitrosotalea sinensis]|uniref:Glycosyltransferase, group 2 family protein n=1 Tax=Nitrosotalea sinensis TaxID=1499975 RepID=A0A2H1EEB8_9ARCH|nr:glycosyltransferase family 2 protein [Candidatus Nitrosotalea sinensis]SHO42818.1 Glycosyltransferase, group 2 family protein [Candidatus Nitrosotalea sinensis]